MDLILSQKQFRIFKKICFYCVFVGLIFFSLLKAYRESFDLYLSITQLIKQDGNTDTDVYLSGRVLSKSLLIHQEQLSFKMYDLDHHDQIIDVVYQGIAPRLLQEEQDVLLYGQYNREKNIFLVKNIASKHDEYYRVKKT